MTNIWILKKQRSEAGKALVIAREKRWSYQSIDQLKAKIHNLNYKIEALRKNKRAREKRSRRKSK